jgi:hypothetical protein
VDPIGLTSSRTLDGRFQQYNHFIWSQHLSSHGEKFSEPYAALAQDIVVLERVAQLAMEYANQRITYFARLDEIARYGAKIQNADIDRVDFLESIHLLCVQYGQQMCAQEVALQAAYTLREAFPCAESPHSSDIMYYD